MNRRHPPSPRELADRVVGYARRNFAAEFADQLLGWLDQRLPEDLKVNDEERQDLPPQLLEASEGRAVDELESVLVNRLVARRAGQVATAGARAVYREHRAALADEPDLAAHVPTPRDGREATPVPGAAPPPPSSTTTTPAPPAVPTRDRGASKYVHPLGILSIPAPQNLVSTERIRTARVLTNVFFYGEVLRLFSVPPEALNRLDDDRLCLNDPQLAQDLVCWSSRRTCVDEGERARLYARVLGIAPAEPAAQPLTDTQIQPLLGQLIDAINVNCDLSACHDEPSTQESVALGNALRRVQSHLSATVTGTTTARARELAGQLETVQQLATQLATSTSIRLPCRPQLDPAYPAGGVESDGANALNVVASFFGTTFPDGTDIIDSFNKADAWDRLFEFVENAKPSANTKVKVHSDVCDAAALLRPTRPAQAPAPVASSATGGSDNTNVLR